MDSSARAQVRLVLEDLVIRAKKTTEARVKGLFQKHAAEGMLYSGSTIKGVVAAAEEIAAEFLTDCVDQVAPVAKDPEAFSMIEDAIDDIVRFMGTKVDQGFTKAAGSKSDGAGAIQSATDKLWGESKRALARKLEIHRYSFTVPYRSEVKASPQSAASRKNRGGKPLAAHWDELWAATAVKLYNGDLLPKTQADIERTMKEWLIANELDASDSAVRDRARALWRALERDE